MFNEKNEFSDFAELLRATRKEKRLTQQQLSDAIGIKRSTYAYYELGKSEPSLDKLIKISNVLGVSCDYLIGNSLVLSSNGNKYNIDAEAVRLSENENEIIKTLRQLNDKEKQSVLEYIDNLLSENK